MKRILKALSLAIFTFIIAGQFTANAQGGFGGGGFGGGGFGGGAPAVTGAVSAVDTTANTITVQGRGQDATPTTVKINGDTKFTKVVTVALSTLKVGDIIQAGSAQAYQQGDTSIDATRITVLAALPPARPAGGAGGGAAGGARRGGRGLAGTIATTTPSLTIKTAAGDTITVNTTDTTTVSATQPATIADIATGTNVSITTATDTNATLFAKIVAVVPAFQRRAGGGAGGGAAGN
jgi:hypothetical protein